MLFRSAGEAASENAATCKRTALIRMVCERVCDVTNVEGRRVNGIRVGETEPGQRWGNESRNARRGRRACRRARVDRIGGILGRLTQRTRVVCFHASTTIGLGLGEGERSPRRASVRRLLAERWLTCVEWQHKVQTCRHMHSVIHFGMLVSQALSARSANALEHSRLRQLPRFSPTCETGALTT